MQFLWGQKVKKLQLYYSSIPVFVVFIGLILRVSLVFTEANFDYESYKITADLIIHLTPPWRSYRYNYGLPWSIVLGFFREMSFGSDFIFRLLLTLLLAVVDLSIAALLAKWFDRKVAIIFFLNPVSILISGHYIQFDNLALFIGMVAIYFLERYRNTSLRADYYCAVGLFTVSLSIKHTLFVFILWALFFPLHFKDRLRLILIPSIFFLLQFLPFMLYSKQDFQSISSSVFKYWSSNNAPFWKFWFWNKDFAESLGDFNAWHHGRIWMILMIATLMAIGYLARELSIPTQFAVFTIALLIFASAITSQFLAIACIGASVFFNFGFAAFFVISSYFLLIDPAGLSLNFQIIPGDFRDWNSWNTAPSLLIVGSLVYFICCMRRAAKIAN